MARYRDIATALRNRFGSEFHVGDRLPGISTLQQQYDVPGLNTVRAALRLLADEGLVRTEPGIGSFVTAVPAPRSSGDDAFVSLRVTVPEQARRALSARASARGQSLDAYLVELITRDADRPTVGDVLDRAARRVERAEVSSLGAVAEARAERESGGPESRVTAP